MRRRRWKVCKKPPDKKWQAEHHRGRNAGRAACAVVVHAFILFILCLCISSTAACPAQSNTLQRPDGVVNTAISPVYLAPRQQDETGGVSSQNLHRRGLTEDKKKSRDALQIVHLLPHAVSRSEPSVADVLSGDSHVDSVYRALASTAGDLSKRSPRDRGLPKPVQLHLKPHHTQGNHRSNRGSNHDDQPESSADQKKEHRPKKQSHADKTPGHHKSSDQTDSHAGKPSSGKAHGKNKYSHPAHVELQYHSESHRQGHRPSDNHNGKLHSTPHFGSLHSPPKHKSSSKDSPHGKVFLEDHRTAPKKHTDSHTLKSEKLKPKKHTDSQHPKSEKLKPKKLADVHHSKSAKLKQQHTQQRSKSGSHVVHHRPQNHPTSHHKHSSNHHKTSHKAQPRPIHHSTPHHRVPPHHQKKPTHHHSTMHPRLTTHHHHPTHHREKLVHHHKVTHHHKPDHHHKPIIHHHAPTTSHRMHASTGHPTSSAGARPAIIKPKSTSTSRIPTSLIRGVASSNDVQPGGMVPSTPPTPYKSSIVSTGKGGSTLGAPSLAGEFSTLLSRLTRTSSKSGVSDATSPTYGQSREAVPSAPRGNEKPLAQDKPAAAASSQPPPDGTTSGQAAEPRLPLAPSKAALASSQSLQPMPVPTLLSSPAPTLLNSPASAAGHVDLAPQDPDVLPKTQAATAGQGSPEDPGKGGSSTGQSSNSIPKVNVSAGGDAALGEVRLGGPASESSGSTSTTVSNAGGKSPGDGNGGPLPKDKLEGGGGDSSKTQGGRTNKAQVGTAPLEQQNGRVTPNKDAEQGGLAQGKAAGGTGGDGSKSSGVDSKSDNSKGTSSVKSGDDANINNDSTSGNGEGKTAGTDVESGGGDTGSVNSVEDANNEQELDLAPLPLDANVNPGPDQQGTRPAKGAKGDPVEQSDSRSDAAVPAKEDEDAADPVNVAEEPVNIEEGGATEPKDTASEPSEAAPEDPALAPPEAEGAVAGSSESPLDEVDLQPDALEPPAGENADEPAGPIPGPQAQTDDPDHSVDEVDLQPADTPELEPIDTPSAEPAVEPEEIDIEGPSESPEAAGQDVEPEAEAPDAEPDTLDEAAPEEAELQDANGVVLLPGDEAATASLDVAADPPAAEDDGESDGEGIDPPEAEDGEAPDENDMPPDTSSDPVEAPGETAEPASPDEAEVPIPDEDEAPAPAEEAESSEIPEPADELAPVPPPPPAPLVFMVGAFTHDLAAALCPLAAITSDNEAAAFALTGGAGAWIGSWNGDDYGGSCIALEALGSIGIPAEGCDARLGVLCETAAPSAPIPAPPVPYPPVAVEEAQPEADSEAAEKAETEAEVDVEAEPAEDEEAEVPEEAEGSDESEEEAEPDVEEPAADEGDDEPADAEEAPEGETEEGEEAEPEEETEEEEE